MVRLRSSGENVNQEISEMMNPGGPGFEKRTKRPQPDGQFAFFIIATVSLEIEGVLFDQQNEC
jgi:hypothetical protein